MVPACGGSSSSTGLHSNGPTGPTGSGGDSGTGSTGSTRSDRQHRADLQSRRGSGPTGRRRRCFVRSGDREGDRHRAAGRDGVHPRWFGEHGGQQQVDGGDRRAHEHLQRDGDEERPRAVRGPHRLLGRERYDERGRSLPRDERRGDRAGQQRPRRRRSRRATAAATQPSNDTPTGGALGDDRRLPARLLEDLHRSRREREEGPHPHHRRRPDRQLLDHGDQLRDEPVRDPSRDGAHVGHRRWRARSRRSRSASGSIPRRISRTSIRTSSATSRRPAEAGRRGAPRTTTPRPRTSATSTSIPPAPPRRRRRRSKRRSTRSAARSSPSRARSSST